MQWDSQLLLALPVRQETATDPQQRESGSSWKWLPHVDGLYSGIAET